VPARAYNHRHQKEWRAAGFEVPGRVPAQPDATVELDDQAILEHAEGLQTVTESLERRPAAPELRTVGEQQHPEGTCRPTSQPLDELAVDGTQVVHEHRARLPPLFTPPTLLPPEPPE
jgi:hypothetical protein